MCVCVCVCVCVCEKDTLMRRMAEAEVRFRLAWMNCVSNSEKEASGVVVRPGMRMLWSSSSRMGRCWVLGHNRSST